MKCPLCNVMLRVMDSKEIERDGKKVTILYLYCKKRGCPNNNGKPVYIEEVEENGTE